MSSDDTGGEGSESQGAFDFDGGADLEAAARRAIAIERLVTPLTEQLSERGGLELYENIELPLFYLGHDAARSAELAGELADGVGLGDRLHHRPTELSGGEQQRIAFARAVVGDPKIILADEPTGNLDEVSADIILELLKRFHTRGATVIIATHDKELIRKTGGRVIHLNQGYMQKTINV